MSTAASTHLIIADDHPLFRDALRLAVASVVSQAKIGEAGSFEELTAMLEREYGLLIERLAQKRGANTKFFVFADTVAARSYSRKEVEAHGWLGVRFQTEPQGEPSQIIIHVRLLDPENLQEQEALGIIGVNLVHAALHRRSSVDEFVQALIEAGTAGQARR